MTIRLPIVAATEPEGNLHDHPMRRDSISVRVPSPDEAIEAVVSIVSPGESLIWTRLDQIGMLMEENRLPRGIEPSPEDHVGSRPQ